MFLEVFFLRVRNTDGSW